MQNLPPSLASARHVSVSGRQYRSNTLPFCFLLLWTFLGCGLHAQEISPLLFGQNYWMGEGDESRTGYLHLLWPRVRECGVQLVRIGGNEYNIHPPSLVRWIAMVESVQAIGAEPLVQIPAAFSDVQTAALVQHLNANGRKPVRYWSIGNEPMLHDEYTLPQVHAYLLRIATALRAADPAARILISDEAWMRAPVYEALCGGDLDLTGKDAAGHWLIDGFSFHSYPNGEKFERNDVTTTGVEKIRNDVQRLVALLDRANVLHGRTGDARLRWALTEVNVTYANPNRDIDGIGNPSFVAGQFMAEIFGIGMEYNALTIAPWSINEPDNIKTDFGFLGLPPDFAPRSSYYHMQMMAEHLTGRFMKTVSPDPLLKLIGTRSGKRIAILVLNEDLEKSRSFDLSLSLDGSPLQADAGLKAHLTGEIPGQTSQIYVLNPDGKIVERITYGLAENLRYLPPQRKRF